VARLRITSGPLSGQSIELQGDLVVGREDTDLEIDDAEISRRHAVLRRHADRLQVEDLGSKNGTFVNGDRIEEPTLVGGGAEIRMGTTVLVVEGVLPLSANQPKPEEIDPKTTRVSEVPPEMRRAPSAPAPSAPAPSAPAPSAPAPAAPAPPAPAPPAPAAPQPAGPVGEFRPPQRRRQRGLASRSWVPVALSFGTAILTAVALVIYFGLR
jgi:hypothetical protein